MSTKDVSLVSIDLGPGIRVLGPTLMNIGTTSMGMSLGIDTDWSHRIGLDRLDLDLNIVVPKH